MGRKERVFRSESRGERKGVVSVRLSTCSSFRSRHEISIHSRYANSSNNVNNAIKTKGIQTHGATGDRKERRNGLLFC